MSKIENSKIYLGKELEAVFFRPMLTGKEADALGVRVLYNVPAPTTLRMWKRSGDILQKYSSTGWNGVQSDKVQKALELAQVKAETGYSAQDYFNLVYENIAGRADVNMDDLSGTELEAAETALFKESIAESIRATMWVGNTARADSLGYNTFDGFLHRILAALDNGMTYMQYDPTDPEVEEDPNRIESLFANMLEASHAALKELKSQGNLVIFATSDLCSEYEATLDKAALDSAWLSRQNGHNGLFFRGIPVVDVQLSKYLAPLPDMPKTFALLTDRRNLTLAVNTSDFPGTEVRMWYNPDEMQNRQRAIFMAGCDFLLDELITFAWIP
ncbi:MAG: hypothetical protein LBH06_09360 [Rikenellaceae bacterium]|jgi:hypothetical protein|nr:hypothetical protein [Rikenellaceae bacterium]